MTSDREEDGLQVRRYWINDCQYCPLQHRCTSGKERRITRWEHEHLIDEMRQRLGRDPDPMTLRRCTVEHPFGTIKAWMGATHFQMRRLKNVRTEMALHVLAYNIKRMISLAASVACWSRSRAEARDCFSKSDNQPKSRSLDAITRLPARPCKGVLTQARPFSLER
jgi:Transposase DDE domain